MLNATTNLSHPNDSSMNKHTQLFLQSLNCTLITAPDFTTPACMGCTCCGSRPITHRKMNQIMFAVIRWKQTCTPPDQIQESFDWRSCDTLKAYSCLDIKHFTEGRGAPEGNQSGEGWPSHSRGVSRLRNGPTDLTNMKAYRHVMFGLIRSLSPQIPTNLLMFFTVTFQRI